MVPCACGSSKDLILGAHVTPPSATSVDVSVIGGLGTPPSAVVWAALPLKMLITFLSNVLPFMGFGGLICRLWNKRRATFYQQSRLVWGRPFAPLLAAFSVMMRISGRRFTPCITLEFSRHLLGFVALAICVCLRRFSSGSRKHGTLIPFDSLLIFGQSLNVTSVVDHFTRLLMYLI